MEGDGVYRFGLDRRSVLGCDCKSETPSTVKRENGTVFLFVLTMTVFLTFCGISAGSSSVQPPTLGVKKSEKLVDVGLNPSKYKPSFRTIFFISVLE